MQLEIRNLQKSYGDLKILQGLNLKVNAGELMAITGESGAGKSTFFNLMAGLDDFESGEVFLGDYPLHEMSQVEKAQVRGANIGIVFQEFHLVAALTALENVRLVLDIHQKQTPLAQRQHQAEEILRSVGLGERLDHRPSELSGGEQQRVALARALVHRPPIVLADEPTGNLDEKTSEQIQNLLIQLCQENQSSLILITHDPRFAKKMQRHYQLSQGQFEELTQ